MTPEQLSFCRAIKVYTIEGLYYMEGDNLKSLGMHRNALKEYANKYMANQAAGSAARQEIDALREEIAALKADRAIIPAAEATKEEIDAAEVAADASIEHDAFAGKTIDEIKNFIADKSGIRPRGNPSRQALIGMARSYL